MLGHERAYERGHLIRLLVERKMAGVDQVDFSVGNLAFVSLRFRSLKRLIVSSPHHERRRLRLPEPGLPCGITCDVGPVVEEEVDLDVAFARFVDKRELVRPQVRIIIRDVGTGAEMPPLRSGQRRKALSEASLIRRSVRPEFPHSVPTRSQTVIVGDGVLDDNALHAFRMRDGESKSNRTAIILHVQYIAAGPDSFRKVLHDFRDMIEGIGERFRIWRIAMSEARIVGSEEME